MMHLQLCCILTNIFFKFHTFVAQCKLKYLVKKQMHTFLIITILNILSESERRFHPIVKALQAVAFF